MKRGGICLSAGLCAVIMVALISGESLTITGAVNEDYEIVADDGHTYKVKSNEMGDEVVDLVGKPVRVKGVVEVIGE